MRLGIMLASVLVAACQPGGLRPSSSGSAAKIASPASVYCSQSGGELRIETLGSGGQIGVCWFEDGRQCEEWALVRGACPVGGRRVTGYLTPGARYCAIRGGRYQISISETSTAPEQGLCILPDGTHCDAQSLWNGACG